MTNLIALISILILGAIFIVLAFGKPKSGIEVSILIVYGYNLLSESAMYFTSRMRLNNHFIANMHTILFGIGMLVILVQIWQRLLKKKVLTSVLAIAIVFYIAVWVFDNFIYHQITTFNPFCQSLIFSVNLVFSVYLLNVVLFLSEAPLRKSVEGILTIGLMINSVTNVIIDLFFDYYLHLDYKIYFVISQISMGMIIVSHFLVFLAVVWIILKKKYMSQLFP